MNKIIGIIILVVLAAGLIYFFGFQADDASTPEDDAEAVTGGESYRGNLLALMSRGGNTRCSWEGESEGVVSRGTVYVAGSSQIRADYESQMDGEMTTGHLIRSGDMVYVWSADMEQGFQMAFDEERFFGGTDTTAETPAVDPNQEYDYECSSWNPDQAMFTPPSDVEFVDMSAMMDSAIDAMGGAGAMCAQCDAITDPNAKVQCRAALNCQ